MYGVTSYFKSPSVNFVKCLTYLVTEAHDKGKPP